jgi:transcriptional regulator with XRE-family HTH domain
MAKGNFGERMKRERELREVSLAEVTRGTRISPQFLEALENEQWLCPLHRALPGPERRRFSV